MCTACNGTGFRMYEMPAYPGSTRQDYCDTCGGPARATPPVNAPQADELATVGDWTVFVTSELPGPDTSVVKAEYFAVHQVSGEERKVNFHPLHSLPTNETLRQMAAMDWPRGHYSPLTAATVAQMYSQREAAA